MASHLPQVLRKQIGGVGGFESLQTLSTQKVGYWGPGWDFSRQGGKNLSTEPWTLWLNYGLVSSIFFLAILDVTEIITLLSWFYIRRMKYCRNFLLAEKHFCQKKKFCLRDFVQHERISCHRTKFPVTGRNFLLQDEISCHRTKFHVTVRNFKWCIIICIRNVVIFILI